MDKRMFAIVEDLVRRILHEGEPVGNSGEIVQTLLKQGYAMDEIQQAFAWIFSDKEIISDESPSQQLYMGERIFSPNEEEKLSSAFRWALLRLLYTDQISKAEMEQVLVEALKLSQNEVDEKELYGILPRIISNVERLSLMIPATYGGEKLLH